MEIFHLLPHPSLDYGRFTHIMAFHIWIPLYFLLVGRRIECVRGSLLSSRFERSISGWVFQCVTTMLYLVCPGMCSSYPSLLEKASSALIASMLCSSWGPTVSPVKHGRVFLVPCKKWLVQCKILYTRTKYRKTRSCLSGQVVQGNCSFTRGLGGSVHNSKQLNILPPPPFLKSWFFPLKFFVLFPTWFSQ